MKYYIANKYISWMYFIVSVVSIYFDISGIDILEWDYLQ